MDGLLVGPQVVGVAEFLLAVRATVTPLHPALQSHVAGQVRTERVGPPALRAGVHGGVLLLALFGAGAAAVPNAAVGLALVALVAPEAGR